MLQISSNKVRMPHLRKPGILFYVLFNDHFNYKLKKLPKILCHSKKTPYLCTRLRKGGPKTTQTHFPQAYKVRSASSVGRAQHF